MDKDGLITNLPEGFKHHYRGKKVANDYWLNYSRCAEIMGERLFFISDKDRIVAYNLDTLKYIVPQVPVEGQSAERPTYPVYGEIQCFAAVSKDLIVALTEDCRLILVDFKNGGGGKKILETKISEGTVTSTIYTDIVAEGDQAVATGYRDDMRSNTFVLFHKDLKVQDTIEVVNLAKGKADQHHIHLMKLFFRKGYLHLLAMNIASSLHLMVVYEDRMHPVAVNINMSDGRLC